MPGEVWLALRRSKVFFFEISSSSPSKKLVDLEFCRKSEVSSVEELWLLMSRSLNIGNSFWPFASGEISEKKQKNRWLFLSSCSTCKKLMIDTLMKEAKPIVFEKYEKDSGKIEYFYWIAFLDWIPLGWTFVAKTRAKTRAGGVEMIWVSKPRSVFLNSFGLSGFERRE